MGQIFGFQKCENYFDDFGKVKIVNAFFNLKHEILGNENL